VNIVPALQTTELIVSVVVWAIILVSESALRATLARVRRMNLLHLQPFRLDFVRDALEQTVECLLVNLFRVRQAFADACELLRHDMRTVVFAFIMSYL
jgi:hypothetical protein